MRKDYLVKAPVRSSKRIGNSGMGTVEIILIIVVLIGLVIIFRSQITSFVNSIFTNITDTTTQFKPGS